MSQQLWEQEQGLAERIERVDEIVEAIFWKADHERELESHPASSHRAAYPLWSCQVATHLDHYSAVADDVQHQ